MIREETRDSSDHVFPFRRVQSEDSPASLMWGTEGVQLEGDPRQGMFEHSRPNTTEPSLKPLDLKTLKAIYGSTQRAANIAPTPMPSPRISEIKHPDSLGALEFNTISSS